MSLPRDRLRFDGFSEALCRIREGRGHLEASNSRFAPNIPIRAMSEGSLGTM